MDPSNPLMSTGPRPAAGPLTRTLPASDGASASPLPGTATPLNRPVALSVAASDSVVVFQSWLLRPSMMSTASFA